MVGIDGHFRLGRNIEEGRALHDIFMGSGGTLVEFLDNLDQIRRPEFFFMALPFKARRVDSSWLAPLPSKNGDHLRTKSAIAVLGNGAIVLPTLPLGSA